MERSFLIYIFLAAVIHMEQYYLYSSTFISNSEISQLILSFSLSECKFPTADAMNCLDYLHNIVGIHKFAQCESLDTELTITDDKFIGMSVNNTKISFDVPIQCTANYNPNISAILTAKSGSTVMLGKEAMLGIQSLGMQTGIMTLAVLALILL